MMNKFWEEVLNTEHINIVVGSECYTIKPEGSKGMRGFGGREFIFRDIKTNKVIISHNVWYRGTVPDEYLEKLPATHTMNDEISYADFIDAAYYMPNIVEYEVKGLTFKVLPEGKFCTVHDWHCTYCPISTTFKANLMKFCTVHGKGDYEFDDFGPDTQDHIMHIFQIKGDIKNGTY